MNNVSMRDGIFQNIQSKLKFLFAFLFVFMILAIPNVASAATPANIVNINVPTKILVNQLDSGDVTVSKFEIDNTTTSDIAITNINATSTTGWDFATNTNDLTFDQKKILLNMDNMKLQKGDNVSNIEIKKGMSKDLTPTIKMPMFSRSFNEDAFNLTLTYNLLKPVYKIVYDTNGGLPVPPSITASAGDTITLPKDPEVIKSGKVLDGWQTDEMVYGASCLRGDIVLPDSIPETANGTITFKADWMPKPPTQITFDTNGATESCLPMQVPYNSKEKITLPTVTKEGYKFIGWKSSTLNDENLYTSQYEVPLGHTGIITMTAQWAKVVKVSFNGNGSVETFEPIIVTPEGERNISLGTPTKSGFTFGGWECSLDSKLYKNTYTVPQNANTDITMTAKWSRDVTVSFNGNGSVESYDSISVTSYTDRTITLPLNNPTKTGYEFIGWTSSLDSKTYNGTYTVPRNANTSNITMTAKWSRNVTVKFNTGGYGTFNDVNITSPINRTVTLPTPTRDGYNFKGWDCSLDGQNYTGTYKVPQDASQSTITMTANWELSYYKVCTVQYDTNGGKEVYGNDVIYNTDSRYVTLPTPTRSGYKFLGWTTNSSSDNGKKFQGGERYYVYSYPDPLVFTAQWEVEKKVLIMRNFCIPTIAVGGSYYPVGSTMYLNNLNFDLFRDIIGNSQIKYWRCEETGETVTNALTIPTNPTYEEYHYTAVWDKPITVTFDPGEGEPTSSKTVYVGEKFSVPRAPKEHRDAIFVAWADEKNSFTNPGEVYKYKCLQFPGAGEPATYRFNGRWNHKASCQMDYIWLASTGYENDLVRYYEGETVTLPSSHCGVGIQYWRHENSNTKFANGGGTYVIPKNPPMTICLCPVYNAKNTYKWNFNGNGTASRSESHYAGERFSPPQPKRTGYTFKGWKVAELNNVIWNATVWKNKLQTDGTRTFTCTAVWQKNK